MPPRYGSLSEDPLISKRDSTSRRSIGRTIGLAMLGLTAIAGLAHLSGHMSLSAYEPLASVVNSHASGEEKKDTHARLTESDENKRPSESDKQKRLAENASGEKEKDTHARLTESDNHERKGHGDKRRAGGAKGHGDKRRAGAKGHEDKRRAAGAKGHGDKRRAGEKKETDSGGAKRHGDKRRAGEKKETDSPGAAGAHKRLSEAKMNKNDYATEQGETSQMFSKGPKRTKRRYDVPENAYFDSMDEEHQAAHGTMGSTSLMTGKKSRGVVTLDGVWTEKQLDNFDAMSIDEQHEFFKHYNERLNRHKRGDSKRGGGKADCSRDNPGVPCQSDGYCAPASNLRACWLQDEQGCAANGARCEWHSEREGTQCEPKDADSACENLGCNEEGVDCACDDHVLCEWHPPHTKNNFVAHGDRDNGIRTRVHVGTKAGEKRKIDGTKGFGPHKMFRFSKTCDLCELFGIDNPACDNSNFAPLVKAGADGDPKTPDDSYVRDGGAGTCKATLKTGENCSVECKKGFRPAATIMCRSMTCGDEATCGQPGDRGYQECMDMCEGNAGKNIAVLSPREIPEGGWCPGSPCRLRAPQNGSLGDCPAGEMEHGSECTPSCDEGFRLTDLNGGKATCYQGTVKMPKCEAV